MSKLENHELNKKQVDACKKIERAFANAKKLGISFLAKQSDIMAYKRESLKKSVPLHEYWNFGEVIPYYPMRKCIDDSGADDMEYFPKGYIDKLNKNEEIHTQCF